MDIIPLHQERIGIYLHTFVLVMNLYIMWKQTKHVLVVTCLQFFCSLFFNVKLLRRKLIVNLFCWILQDWFVLLYYGNDILIEMRLTEVNIYIHITSMIKLFDFVKWIHKYFCGISNYDRKFLVYRCIYSLI